MKSGNWVSLEGVRVMREISAEEEGVSGCHWSENELLN